VHSAKSTASAQSSGATHVDDGPPAGGESTTRRPTHLATTTTVCVHDAILAVKIDQKK
jgi:hypothetical protein